MYIKRNGKKYDLTEKELTIAYNELQIAKDIQEILYRLEEANEDNSYAEMISELKDNNELARNIAYRYRQYLNCGVNSSYQWACIEDAFEREKRRINNTK